ncbi:MAG: carbon monoxide dehydrogenase subunit G [Anaerolineales bacterium]|nr:carbon monoxide dehydrogenase subunit G [Anaerolineales bacterium]
MKIEGEYIFDGPRNSVWEILRDPDVLASALPGTQNLEQISENEYQGEMQVRIGPVGGLFTGRVIISDEVPPESLIMMVEGKGKPGFVKGTGNVQLSSQEDDKTLMKYQGDMEVGGRLASVGQRMMDSVSKSLLKQGLDSINQSLIASLDSEHSGESVEYEAPSEVEFAASVAKDMAGEALSSRKLWWIVGAVVIILIILAILLLNQG